MKVYLAGLAHDRGYNNLDYFVEMQSKLEDLGCTVVNRIEDRESWKYKVWSVSWAIGSIKQLMMDAEVVIHIGFDPKRYPVSIWADIPRLPFESRQDVSFLYLLEIQMAEMLKLPNGGIMYFIPHLKAEKEYVYVPFDQYFALRLFKRPLLCISSDERFLGINEDDERGRSEIESIGCTSLKMEFSQELMDELAHVRIGEVISDYLDKHHRLGAE